MIKTLEPVTHDALAQPFAAGAAADPWFHVRIGTHTTADGMVMPLGGGGFRVAARRVLTDERG
jgi:hypothetical protein